MVKALVLKTSFRKDRRFEPCTLRQISRACFRIDWHNWLQMQPGNRTSAVKVVHNNNCRR